MGDCSNHKKEVAGISDMKVLAEMIGDLHYETLAEFFDELKKKLNADAKKDYNAGRRLIAEKINSASLAMRMAWSAIDSAWQISKPFMQEKQ